MSAELHDGLQWFTLFTLLAYLNYTLQTPCHSTEPEAIEAIEATRLIYPMHNFCIVL